MFMSLLVYVRSSRMGERGNDVSVGGLKFAGVVKHVARVVRHRNLAPSGFTRTVNVRHSTVSRVLGKEGGMDLSILVGVLSQFACISSS